jgi:putative tryptophan/tyrosine transport system substrate-binding protein
VDTLGIRRAGIELISLRPDVILAQSTLTLAPLQQLTTDIPIVFLQVVDPVAGGFVKSMARPGGNVTGVALGEFSIGAKMLEVLKQVAPQLTPGRRYLQSGPSSAGRNVARDRSGRTFARR